MLTAILVGNFKAFVKTKRIPVCTLIYGANSSVKSNVLYNQNLDFHTRKSDDLAIKCRRAHMNEFLAETVA